MSKEAVFSLKLESELRDQFMAEAEAAHRPASQIEWLPVAEHNRQSQMAYVGDH